jgi:BolA protein
VNTILLEEFKNGLHALSINAKTPQQWEADSTVTATPNCQGGSKR